MPEKIKNKNSNSNEISSFNLMNNISIVAFWSILIFGVIFAVTHKKELSPTDNKQINTQEINMPKDESPQVKIKQIKAKNLSAFKAFEKNIYATPEQCDADYNKAYKEVQNNNIVDAYSDFGTANFSCLEASNNIGQTKIPELLDANLQEKLKTARETLRMAYLSKHFACVNFKKYLDKNEIQYISKAKDDLTSYENRLISGAAYLVEVKMTLEK